MDKEKYMSGAELRQFLHISMRKMKYLMDFDYIPHENTGQATHKYQVLREDAVAFKARMENEDGFLIELTGKFPSQSHRPPRKHILEPTPKNCEAFRKYLTKLWTDLPDALPTKQAAALIGCCPQHLHELVKKGNLHGVKVGSVQVIVKDEVIEYVSSPEQVVKVKNEKYQKLIVAAATRF